MPSLTSINTISSGQAVFVSADGAGSEIDLSELTSFDTVNGGFSVTSSATVLDSKLTSLSGAAVLLDGKGTLASTQWTSLTDGTLTISGGTYTLSKLTDIDSSSLDVDGAGSLALPGVISYPNPDFATSLTASGPTSVLSLPALTSFGTLQSGMSIDASQGAQILLPVLTSLDTNNANAFLDVSADGSDTTIDLSNVTSFDIDNGSLSVTDSATVLGSKLTSLSGVAVALDGTGTLAINQWTSLTDDTLTISGGTYTLSKLTDIDSSSLYVKTGGSLTLPAVTSYVNPLAETTFEATSYGSVLSLPALVFPAALPMYVELDAYQGGQTLLPAVTTIQTSAFGIIADGSGSEIDLSRLTSIVVTSGNLTVTDGATVSDGKLTSLTGVYVTLDSAGTLATAQISTFNNGTLYVSGNNFSVPGLNNFSSGTIDVNGNDLTLPDVTSFTSGTVNVTGGSLSLPGLANADNTSFAVSSGATLTLPDATSFVASGTAPRSTTPVRSTSAPGL